MPSSLLLTVYSVVSWNSSSPVGEDGGGRVGQHPCLDMLPGAGSLAFAILARGFLVVGIPPEDWW